MGAVNYKKENCRRNQSKGKDLALSLRYLLGNQVEKSSTRWDIDLGWRYKWGLISILMDLD